MKLERKAILYSILGFAGTIVSAVIADKLTNIDILNIIFQYYFSALQFLKTPIDVPLVIFLLLPLFFLCTVLFSGRNNVSAIHGRILSLFKQEHTKNNKRITGYNIERLIAGGAVDDDLRLNLLGYQNKGAILAYQKRICSKGYEPGLFCLAEIHAGSKFLPTHQSFDAWLDNTLSDEIKIIKKRYPSLIKNFSNDSIKNRVKELLNLKLATGKTLKHDIWIEEYSDIFRRMILFVTNNDPDKELELYPNLTFERKHIALDVLNWIQENKKPDLKHWLFISIAAGLMGVNEKSRHTAASDIDHRVAILLDSQGEPYKDYINSVGENLWKTANTDAKLDASEWMFQFLELSIGIPIKIVCFPDDYIETIFLLRFYEDILKEYSNIYVDCVPKSVRCGNDAKYDDLVDLMNEFPYLKGNNRFRIHQNGPKIGAINLLKIHPSIMSLIEDSEFLDIRGARSFEMLQGVKKDVFFGFTVCREYSESTTGLLVENRPLIFIRQASGEYSFEGFRERNSRQEKGKMFCLKTANDNKEKCQGGHLGEIDNWTDDEKNRYKAIQGFYSKNALDFYKKYGDYLEQEVRNSLDQFVGNVLVVGCGSGKEVNYLSERGCLALGIDFSVEAIWLAKQIYPHLWDQFFVEDMYNLHLFQQGSYQGIVANAVFVHLLKRDDMKVMLLRVKQRLSSGGLFFLRVIEKEGVEQEYDSKLFRATRWFVYFKVDEIIKWAKEANLEVVHSDRVPHVQYKGVYWISILLRKA